MSLRQLEAHKTIPMLSLSRGTLAVGELPLYSNSPALNSCPLRRTFCGYSNTSPVPRSASFSGPPRRVSLLSILQLRLLVSNQA